MKFISFNKDKKSKNEFKELYNLAFTLDERRPIKLLNHLCKKNKLNVKIVKDDQETIGLVVYAIYQDVLWIDYLAVDPNIRSKGLGKKILEMIKSDYPSHRIFVEVETPDKGLDFSDEKLKRISFYERNGFKSCNVRASVFGCDFSLYSTNGSVSYKEYENITKEIYGIIFFRMAKYSELEPII